MPLLFLPWIGGAVVGAFGWSKLFGSNDAPVTQDERSKSRGWWGFIVLALGLTWFF